MKPSIHLQARVAALLHYLLLAALACGFAVAVVVL